MDSPPVPSPRVKSPPWHICGARPALRCKHRGVCTTTARRPVPGRWPAGRGAHKVGYYPVELGALEVQLVPCAAEAGADAERAEVLRGARHGVREQRDGHAARGLAVQLNVKEHARVVHRAVHGCCAVSGACTGQGLYGRGAASR